MSGEVQIHLEPHPIPLLKSWIDMKSYNYVKIMLRIYPMSETPDMYDLTIILFDNGNLGGVLLFQQNYQMTLKEPVSITAGDNLVSTYFDMCIKML